MTYPLCESCGDSGITERVDKNTLIINDKSVEVDCHYTECKECEFLYATPEQLKLNKEIVINAKKAEIDRKERRVDGEFVSIIILAVIAISIISYFS
tara:strand:- start:5550 stop:5840 length:291 start_codon:yes stop_codon:yes gene_type:complete